MANCKTCGAPMDWGFDKVTGRWVPLEPAGLDGDLDKSFVDENGVLRADHRDRCRGTSINVTRLDKKVPADPAPIAKKRKSRAA